MFKYIALLLVTGYLLNGCQDKKTTVSEQSSLKDTVQFFPVNDFLEADIKNIRETHPRLLKSSQKDSQQIVQSIITFDQFDSLAQLFLSKDITTTKWKSHFSESAFHDLSTSSIVLEYTATDTIPEIRTVTALLDDKTNTLKRVFIRAFETVKGEQWINQYNWKTGNNIQIIKSRQIGNAKLTVETITVSWTIKS